MILPRRHIAEDGPIPLKLTTETTSSLPIYRPNNKKSFKPGNRIPTATARVMILPRPYVATDGPIPLKVTTKMTSPLPICPKETKSQRGVPSAAARMKKPRGRRDSLRLASRRHVQTCLLLERREDGGKWCHPVQGSDSESLLVASAILWSFIQCKWLENKKWGLLFLCGT